MAGRQSKQPPTKEQVAAFVKEYRALCERHGLIVVFDGGYVAREVDHLGTDLDPEVYEEDWSYFRAPYYGEQS